MISAKFKLKKLREFRSQVATLKRKGLLGDSKIDARSAQPNTKAGKSTLKSLIKKYDDVLSGKVASVKVSPDRVKQFRKAGYQVIKSSNRVLVPHSATETVKIRKGEVVIKPSGGIERIQLPIEYHNLEQYLRDAAKNIKKIDAMKRSNQYWGFRFYGFNSSQLYMTIQHAIEDVSKYQSVMEAIGRSRMKQMDVYRNLEIVKVNPSAHWVFPSERKLARSAKYNRAKSKRFREQLKGKGETVQEYYRDANAARQAEYRKRLQKNARHLAKYKADMRRRKKKQTVVLQQKRAIAKKRKRDREKAKKAKSKKSS